MVFTTVTLFLHGADEPNEIADYLDDNDKFVNIGVQAANAIAKRQAVHVVVLADDVPMELFIPFHAIVSATISKAEDTYVKPDDAFCQPVCEEKESFTVTWMDGETSLGTEIYEKGARPSYKGTEPTKEGYAFIGWNTDPEAIEGIDPMPQIAEATTFYAIFEKII